MRLHEVNAIVRTPDYVSSDQVLTMMVRLAELLQWSVSGSIKLVDTEGRPIRKPAQWSNDSDLDTAIGIKARPGVDELIEWFSQRMKDKLHANAHKPHWLDECHEHLFRGLQFEFREVAQAYRDIDWRCPTNDEVAHYIDECIDVAVSAAIAADKARQGHLEGCRHG